MPLPAIFSGNRPFSLINSPFCRIFGIAQLLVSLFWNDLAELFFQRSNYQGLYAKRPALVTNKG